MSLMLYLESSGRVTNRKRKKKMDRPNNIVTVLSLFITVVNIFITVFDSP